MFHIINAILWFIFVASWLIHSFTDKKKSASETKVKHPMFRFLFVFIVVSVILDRKELQPLADYQFFPDNAIIQGIGVFICAAGVIFAVHARNYLGSSWGLPMDVKEKPDLITSGPYSLVRHPIYTGIAIALVGSVFVSGFIWLVWFCILVPYFVYSAFKEEKRMLLQFPESYKAHMKRTKMFVPFIL